MKQILILFFITFCSIYGYSQQRISMSRQIEKSDSINSIVITDSTRQQKYLPPGAETTVLKIIGGAPVWDSISVSGGTTDLTGGKSLTQDSTLSSTGTPATVPRDLQFATVPANPTTIEKTIGYFDADTTLRFYSPIVGVHVPFRRIITVDDFKDAGLSDYDAVVACIATGQREIIFGDGASYNFSSQINITQSNLVFKLNGSTLNWTSSASAVNGFYIDPSVSNITFQDGNFTAPADQQFYAEATATTPTSNRRFIIADNAGASNITIKNCTFENAAAGIKLTGVKGSVYLENNKFLNNYSDYIGSKTDTIFINEIISDRTLINDPTNLYHSGYFNGGKFLKIDGAIIKGGTGHSLQIKWSGSGSGENIRDQLVIDNVTLDSCDGIYLQAAKNVYINNLTGKDITGQLINLGGYITNLKVNGLDYTNSDTTRADELLIIGAGSNRIKTVSLDHIVTTGPVQIETDSIEKVQVSSSIFKNHNVGVSSATSNNRVFRIATGGFASVSLNDCHFIQDYATKSDAFIFRTNGTVDTVGYNINNCSFTNKAAAKSRIIWFNTATLTVPNNFISNCKFKGYTNVGDTGESDQYKAFNCRDIAANDWMPDVNDWKPISNYQAYSGNVGIGLTTTPQQKLHVAGNMRIANGGGSSILEYAEGGKLIWFFQNGNDFYTRMLTTDGRFRWRGTANTDVFAIDIAGNYSIMTGNGIWGATGLIPVDSRLQVRGSNRIAGFESTIDSAYIHIVNSTTGNVHTDAHKLGVKGFDFRFVNQEASGDWLFRSGGINRLKLTYAGLLGVGITPISKTHIYESNTNTDATIGLTIEQGGTGDAVSQYLLTGGRRIVTGIDNSDGDSYKISTSTDLGTNNYLKINPNSETFDLKIDDVDKVKINSQTTNFTSGIRYSGSISASLSSQTDNWSPAGGDSSAVIVVTLTGNQTITGLSLGNFGGQTIIIINSDATDNLILAHQSASSTSTNRLRLPKNADLTIPPGGIATMIYESGVSRWFCSGHSGIESQITYVDSGDSPYTATPADDFILVDCTGGTVTITLPDAADGHDFHIKAYNNTVNDAIIATSGGNIDEVTGYTFSAEYESIYLVPQNGNYWKY